MVSSSEMPLTLRKLPDFDRALAVQERKAVAPGGSNPRWRDHGAWRAGKEEAKCPKKTNAEHEMYFKIGRNMKKLGSCSKRKGKKGRLGEKLVACFSPDRIGGG